VTAPRVSILLPFRDAEATLPACLRSLARQRLREWECVAVDDGSRDGGAAVVDAARAADPRVRRVRQPPRGLVAALRAGLAACRAPVVARMDADDLAHRERLSLQLAALDADPGLAAVGCHVRIVPRRGLTPGMRAYERWLLGIDSEQRVREEAFVECPLAHPTLAIRTSVLRRFGYRDCDWPEDYDLLLRLLAAGLRVSVVPRRLLAWRDGPARLSRTDPRYGLDRFTACKAAFLAEGLLAGRRDYVLWGYGSTGRALSRALEAHGLRPSAIVEVHPRRLHRTIRGAPVIPPDGLAARRGEPIVVSVAGAAARALIRAELARLGFHETQDYVCAA
jgi:glycosyltransferase involved in cell wall biosynthesis